MLGLVNTKMSSIPRFLGSIFVFLSLHYGYSEPYHPFTDQSIMRKASFGRVPANPSMSSSWDNDNDRQPEVSKDTENLDLKILGNAIGEGIVKAQQTQKYKQPMHGQPAMHQTKVSQRSSMFQQQQGGRAQIGNHVASRRTHMVKEAVAERPQMFQEPIVGTQTFQRAVGERPQIFPEPYAGRPQMQRQQFPGRSHNYEQPAAMPITPNFPKAMPSMSFGYPKGAPMRSSIRRAKGYMSSPVRSMQMQWP